MYCRTKLNALTAVTAFLILSLTGSRANEAAPKKLRPAANAAASVKTGKEEDWKDNRWNQTEMGRFVCSVMGSGSQIIAKGLSIRIGDQDTGGVCYDTSLCNLRTGWLGEFLEFDPTRYGLLYSPKPGGETLFFSPKESAWSSQPDYRGLYLNGNRVVLSYRVGDADILESPWLENVGASKIFTRTLNLGETKESHTLAVAELKRSVATTNEYGDIRIVSLQRDSNCVAIAVTGPAKGFVTVKNEQIIVEFPPRKKEAFCKVFIWSSEPTGFEEIAHLIKKSPDAVDLRRLTRPGKTRWGGPLVAKGEIAATGTEPYVVDTIPVPYDNPYKALMFLSGVDFLDNGDAAVGTIHGDVWLVSGIDEKLEKVKWKRFATGLFQPLGLKVVNDKIHVLGRDQITIVHDRNRDGEADFYENFCNQLKTSHAGHDYATCLETDSAGNFYYVNPFGVHRISKDGRKHETIATGWRNPNGMGVGPTGVITVAPQEGNWTPASSICEVKPGGFYGMGGPQVTSDRPLGYDQPLCWLPRWIDNSSGGQVWVKSDKWGPLKNQMLHLSYGRCSMVLVLRETIDGVVQGGVVPLKPRFLSGAMRGTFNEKDGQLYVVGSIGWQTSAIRDGCFQRVRYTGHKVHLPTALHIQENGIELSFSEPIERETAEDTGSYGIEAWNYVYSQEYGSKEYSISQPKEIGHDLFDVTSAKLSPDGKKVFLEIAGLTPVMQMQIQYNLNSAEGKTVRGEIFNTIHKVGHTTGATAVNSAK